jgi:hypothetical protein
MPSTKSQISLNYEIPKSQIHSPLRLTAGERGMSPTRYNRFGDGAVGNGHLDLGFGNYLGFGNWKLEFRIYVA